MSRYNNPHSKRSLKRKARVRRLYPDEVVTPESQASILSHLMAQDSDVIHVEDLTIRKKREGWMPKMMGGTASGKERMVRHSCAPRPL